MGDALSIIDFIVDNRFSTSLSISIVLIVTAFFVLLHECIFRCGGAAVPEWCEPPVRNYRATVPAFRATNYLIFC